MSPITLRFPSIGILRRPELSPSSSAAIRIKSKIATPSYPNGLSRTLVVCGTVFLPGTLSNISVAICAERYDRLARSANRVTWYAIGPRRVSQSLTPPA